MILIPLMKFLDNTINYDIEGFRYRQETKINKGDQSNFTFYKNKKTNKYYCNTIWAYKQLIMHFDDVFIITNSMSYYNKYKDIYKVKHIDYYIYDDYLTYIGDKTYIGENNYSQIIGDYQILFMNHYTKPTLYDEIDYILENMEEDIKIVVSDTNTYLNKNKIDIDSITKYIKSKKDNTITFPKMHRAISKYNYIPDLPLWDSGMDYISSIVFYPFQYLVLLDKVYFKITPMSHAFNIETYNHFIKIGLLELVDVNNFVTYKVKKLPKLSIFNI